MPDIDIDFCMRRRGELIDYVTQKYGRENVAHIRAINDARGRVMVLLTHDTDFGDAYERESENKRVNKQEQKCGHHNVEADRPQGLFLGERDQHPR